MSQSWYLQNDMYFNNSESDALLIEARDVFDEMVQYGNESDDITIDGVNKRAIIQESLSRVWSNGLSSDEKKILARLEDQINWGSIVYHANDYWIVLTNPDDSNKVHTSAIIRRCNLLPFRFKVNDITREVYGYYEKNIYVSSENNAINIPDGQVMVTIPKNSYTTKIKKGDEFYLYGEDWYERYEISGIDKSKRDGNTGLLVIKAKEVQTSETPEQFYSLTPTSPTIGQVVVTPSTLSLTLGNTKQFITNVYDKNGILLSEETVVWSSSDTSIATVDVNGLVTTVSVGNCEVIATSDTDNAIIGKGILNIIEGGSWF